MVHDRLLDAEHLAPYKTLILPNIAALSDAQCDQLRAFVAKGGSIIATQETSLYDEHGVRRKNFALADLFGVDWAGKSEGPMHNSYIRLEHEALPKSSFFAGLEDAPRIINGVTRLEVTPRATFTETPFTLIPSYPDLPMEKVYPRTPKTDVSCLYLRQPAGRVAYFPFDIDRTFWEVLSPDHLAVLRNTLTWATNEPALVEVEGHGLLDVTAWRNPGSITIHLVNLTNPMAMKGPYRDFFPVGPHTLKLRLPADAHAKQARLLVADKVIPIGTLGRQPLTSPSPPSSITRYSQSRSSLSIPPPILRIPPHKQNEENTSWPQRRKSQSGTRHQAPKPIATRMKIDPTAPAGSKNSLGAESVRDGRPATCDDVVEAIDEEGPGVLAISR